MKALYTAGPKRFELAERPKPAPASDEVLVRVRSVAICHTDLNIKNGLSPAVVYPRIPGHEIAGVVEACGSGVKHLRPGDFGALQTIIGCGGCAPCRLGLTNNCEHFDELGLKRDGGFAEYCTIPEKNFVKLDPATDPDCACLSEPLANAVSAVRRAGVKPLHSAVVIGPGPIGLLVLAMLRLNGLDDIILAGTRDERLALGKRYGASHLVNVRMCDAADVIRNQLLGGRGADLVFDCSGTSSGFTLSLATVARFGKIIIEGLVHPDDRVPFSPGMLPGNASIITVEGWLPEDFQTAATLIETRRVDVGGLITHRMPLTQWQRGFELAETKGEGIIKAILHPCSEEE